MAAMFQAQSANWEETQEKMSQFVFPAGAGSLSCSTHGYLMDSLLFFFSVRATRIDFKPRAGTHNARGGKPFSHQPEKPLPPSYVCYRCGQKGATLASVARQCGTWILTFPSGHWIQDCPTNNDRDFDNKPRIKRTTGIPRSFLKSVDSPAGQLSSGVMVTPEGGFVVAQPDS